MAALANSLIDHDRTDKRAGLPLLPEILELIFWQMDESTFFIALQTCTQFAEAGSTRKNLLRQTYRIPGRQSGLESLSNRELLSKSRQRAATSGCMAWVLANIRRCKLPSGTILSKSAFSTNTPSSRSVSPSQNHHVALANENGTITIYDLTSNDIKPTLILDLFDPHSERHSTKIYSLAFSRKGDLIVLHGRDGYICDHGEYEEYHPNDAAPEVSQTCQAFEVYELTTFYRCNWNPEGPAAPRKERRRSQMLALDEAEPLGVALACTGYASVAWRVRTQDKGEHYRISLVRTSSKPNDSLDSRDNCDTTYSQNNIVEFETMVGKPASRNSIRMKFVERCSALLIQNEAMPLYGDLAIYDRDNQPVSNQIYDYLTLDASGRRIKREGFCFGTPFFLWHTNDHPQRKWVGALCSITFLALGILDIRFSHLKDRTQHLYVLVHLEAHSTNSCRRRAHLDRIFLQDVWTPVALLAGWRPSRSTIGSLLVVTPQGNRIASAAWDRILVWTIDPEKLCHFDLSKYFPARDLNATKDLGRIRPILLPPQGVVHAMQWINEDVLFALTDKGIVKWDVGPSASGKRSIDEATD